MLMPLDFTSYLVLIIVPLLGSAKSILQSIFGKKKHPTLKENFIFTAIMSLVVIIFISIFFIRSLPSLETIIFGVIIGVLTWVFQVSFLQSLETGPVSITSIIVSLCLLIPTIFGMVFMQEAVTYTKIIGLCLIVISLILLNLEIKKDKFSYIWIIFVALAFVSYGVCNILQTYFKKLPCGDERNELLLVTYIVCFILSLASAFLYKPKEKIDYKINFTNLFFPIVSGLVLAGHNILMMFSLSILDASLYFPITSALKVIMTFIAGLIIFKEKPRLLQYVGVGLGVVAIILVNIII